MKQTFCICDLEEGEKNSTPHITDEVQRGCESLLGKTCPWTGCVNDWTERQEKNYAAPPLCILTRSCFCRTWMAPRVYFGEGRKRLCLRVCVCVGRRQRIKAWQMLEMFLISQRSLLSFMRLNVASVFVCLSVSAPVYLCVCVRASRSVTEKYRNCNAAWEWISLSSRRRSLWLAWRRACVCVCSLTFIQVHTHALNALLYLEGSVVTSVNARTFEQMLNVCLVWIFFRVKDDNGCENTYLQPDTSSDFMEQEYLCICLHLISDLDKEICKNILCRRQKTMYLQIIPVFSCVLLL